jgi:hypothetical protein
MPVVYQLGYVSTQTRPMSPADLLELLNRARASNQRADITGLLLHREDSFFQVIEGERTAVRELFERIRRDPRHQRVEILFEETCAQREFADWRMGFVELDGVDLRLLPGYSDFLSDHAEPQGVLRELTRSRRLMLMFRSMI